MVIQLYVTTPLGTNYHTDLIFGDCVVNVQGKTLPVDSVQLEIQGWDVILETDWIAKHKVTRDCKKKLNYFLDP